MFLNTSDYPCLTRLVRNVEIISDELAAALAADSQIRESLLTEMAMDHPSNEWTWDNAIHTAAMGYDLRNGSYTMLALYKLGHDLSGTQLHFPETMKLLETIDGLAYACISALSPKATLGRHSHNRSRNIFHLLLNDLIGGDCEIVCGSTVKRLQRMGDNVLFDYSIPHESASHSSNTRFNLMIDFKPLADLPETGGEAHLLQKEA